MNNEHIVRLNCPNCGAGLSRHSSVVKCDYCGSKVFLNFDKKDNQPEIAYASGFVDRSGYYTGISAHCTYTSR